MKRIYIILTLLLGVTDRYYSQSNTDIESTGISINHNEAQKMLYVTYSGKEKTDLDITIKDQQGNILYSEKNIEQRKEHKRSVNLKEFSKGIYFVQVDTQMAQEINRIETN